jgi:nitrite reductase (NADH) large subunit
MRYVIIGAGAAGISAAKVLLEREKGSDIILISTDETVYSRCMLHHVLADKRNLDSISFIDKDFFKKNPVTWMKGKKVKGISFDSKEVILEESRISYDKLLIAAGSKASIPPIKGLSGAANVFSLRDIADVNDIKKATATARKAIVLGAGLIGLDVALALIELGLQVTIVEMAEKVLSLQLDQRSAYQYQKAIEQTGAVIMTSVSVTEALKDEKNCVKAVKLSNDTELECDLLVTAIGVKPNTDFLKADELDMDRGIKVDDTMKTSVPDVYAAGDITGLSGIWPNAVKQGMVAAYNMTGKEEHYTDYFTAKNAINLFGVETVSIGLPVAPDDSYKVDIYDKDGIYKKFIYKDGIVYGAILQKDVSRSGFWTKVIKDKVRIDTSIKSIINISYADYFEEDENGNFLYAE